MEACEEGIQIAFVCPCKGVEERHLAIPTDRSFKYKKVVCSMNKSVAIRLSDLGVHAEVWLGEQYSKEGKTNKEMDIIMYHCDGSVGLKL